MFNIYHIFAPFLKLCGCRFLYFFSLCDVRNKVVFLIPEHISLRGVKQKKQDILAFKPLLKEIQLNNQLSERFSEALTSKFWNKKKTCCRSLQKLSKIELCSPSWFYQNSSTIHLRDNQVKLNGKTVFSKLTQKIYLSI